MPTALLACNIRSGVVEGGHDIEQNEVQFIFNATRRAIEVIKINQEWTKTKIIKESKL